MLLAPGATAHAVSAPSHERAVRTPPIDENVLAENCGYEIVDGQVYELSPADEDHGTEHFNLPGLFKHCLKPEFKGTVDMLTRPSKGSNFAPDVSILKRARDPETDGRHVEEVIFEVIDSESRKHVSDKTRQLIARGVRRAFLIDTNQRSVSEWSRQTDGWVRLGDEAVIDDPCLAVPVPARALLDEATNEDVVAEAMVARNNPIIAHAVSDAEQRGEQRGELRGRREALRSVAKAAGVTISDDDQARIDACVDTSTLDAWIARAVTARSADAIFGR